MFFIKGKFVSERWVLACVGSIIYDYLLIYFSCLSLLKAETVMKIHA